MLAFLFLYVLSALSVPSLADNWWKTASLYQIYPLSFKDSDGDGTGDIRGIISQVQYLADIQVDAVWLSPILQSPFEDNGYDCSNYTSINPKFGTTEDLVMMIDEFHKRNIKVLLDFVPNHTSDKHKWFVDSVNRQNGKDDFYVWVNATSSQSSSMLPPNNWKSLFNGGKGSAWSYHEGRKQFYLHQFGDFQPDLNYRNKLVIDEMKKVVEFWFNKGIDGFRVDAVPFLIEGDVQNNEPFINGCKLGMDYYECYNHTQTMNQDGTYDIIYQFGNYAETFNGDKIMFLEGYTDLNNTFKFFSPRTIPFNFDLLTMTKRESKAGVFVEAINRWMNNLPKDAVPNWVIGNHDNSRVGSRLGEDMINVMNMLVLLLPGASVTYYGEEIGMMDGNFKPINDTNGAVSRDPERTPMQWDNSTNAGFSNASTTWLPVNPNYYRINVEAEKKSPNSTLAMYMQLKELRKDVKKAGWSYAQNISEYVLAVRRENFFILVNLNNFIEEADLQKLEVSQNPIGKLRFTTVLMPNITNGMDVDFSKKFKMQPRSGYVFQVNGSPAAYSSILVMITCLSTFLIKYL